MHAMTTPRSRPENEAVPYSPDGPSMLELLQELTVLQAQLARQAAEIERLKQVCCPWQAYSWHRWPH
jgi:hypothetical protein